MWKHECNLLSALHASQGFEAGKNFPKGWNDAACYFSQALLFPVSALDQFCPSFCALWSLCAQWLLPKTIIGTDKMAETLISLCFELPGHSSLFHLDTLYGKGAPTSVPCKTPRSPGLPSEVGALRAPRCLRLVWHHCKWEGVVAGGCFERFICCCMLCVSSPAPGLGIKFKHCCCSLWSWWEFGCCFQWQLKWLLKQQVLTVPQAGGVLGGQELPLFLTLPHTKLCRSQVDQHSKQAACESFPPRLLRFLTFELKLYKGNCFWSLCVSPC